MTTAEAVAIFKILQDKYASPHLIDSEIVRMLNMAQYERLNRLVPDDMGGVVNFEQDQNVALNLKPFIYFVSPVSPAGADCIITDTAINTALQDLTGVETDTYFRVCNLLKLGGQNDPPIYCKYTKHNNIYRLYSNSFKAPGASGVFLYTNIASGFQIHPIEQATQNADFGITVIKHPKKLALETTVDPAVDPEWDDYNMNLIIMIALQLAGISTRDEELIADIRNTKITN